MKAFSRGYCGRENVTQTPGFEECVKMLWRNVAYVFCNALCCEAFFRSKRKGAVRR